MIKINSVEIDVMQASDREFLGMILNRDFEQCVIVKTKEHLVVCKSGEIKIIKVMEEK